MQGNNPTTNPQLAHITKPIRTESSDTFIKQAVRTSSYVSAYEAEFQHRSKAAQKPLDA
jgi:hypothetical protein